MLHPVSDAHTIWANLISVSKRYGLWALTVCLLSIVQSNLAQAQLPQPITDADFREGGQTDPATVKLGRLLFFDKILSGNRNISCATCHHPLTGTGDGLSLPVGEGGRGLGVTRDTGIWPDQAHERVPRNSPPIFNLGAIEFKTLFHDGRVAEDPTQLSGFVSPAGADLPVGLANVLAVQAMFPVTSGTEMAGQQFENRVGSAAGRGRFSGDFGVWVSLANRLRSVPEYVELFLAAFPDITDPGEISYVHAANAIAAFEAAAFRADNSPFDRYLRGESDAMTPRAIRGMDLFYGEANCVSCHSGKFLTDQKFHAIAMPQIGPGKGDGPVGNDDFGRARVTGRSVDKYRFRTPSLRNVALTGPWGHGGAFSTLRAVVLHHLDPVSSLRIYDHGQVSMPSRADLDQLDFSLLRDPAALSAIENACEIEGPAEFTPQEIEDLIEFLMALTDPSSIDLRHTVPARVPSGLPLAE